MNQHRVITHEQAMSMECPACHRWTGILTWLDGTAWVICRVCGSKNYYGGAPRE